MSIEFPDLPIEKKKIIYLDHAATTPIDTCVIEAMNPFLHDFYGNASSIHFLGKQSRETINKCRYSISQHIHSNPKEIIFTGSGTEANNIAILGTVKAMLRQNKKHIITSLIEHSSVKLPFKKLKKNGWDISWIKVGANGVIDPKDIEKVIREDTALISIMYINNEIGTIQPIAEIGEIAKKNQIIFHTDAVQACGKIPVDVQELNVDLLTGSGHKFYGPKGIGFIYIKNHGFHEKYDQFIDPIQFGGGQEFEYRPATENIASIVGMTVALNHSIQEMSTERERLEVLQKSLIDWIMKEIPGSFLNGDKTNRIYSNINIGFEDIEGDRLVLKLSEYGIATSTGSACSSHDLKPSDTLLAIGLSAQKAQGSLRITMGKSTTMEQLDILKVKLKEIVNKLRTSPDNYPKCD